MYQRQARREATVAFLLELILGWLGFLGIGHIYAGRPLTGVILLLVWWVLIGGNIGLNVLSGGGVCCLTGPFHLLVPLVSALFLYGRIRV